MVLVDSSVWIDYFNGGRHWQSDRLDALLATEIVATGDLILAEVLQGFRSDRDWNRVREWMKALHYVDLVGYENAIESSKRYRILRRKGVTVRKTIDVLIATACIRKGWMLLHRDTDFDACERHLGLRVVKKG